MAFFLVRLFNRAVIGHEEQIAKAEQQYLVRKAIEPTRGKIYAQDASIALEQPKSPLASWIPLATNRTTYALSVVPRNLEDARHTAELLAPWAQMDVNELYEKINNDRLYLPPLRRGLTAEERDELLALRLRGLLLLEEQQRYYPEGSLASQVLGFVNVEREGNYGVEQRYDEELRGSGGEVLAERDARGRLLTIDDPQPVKDGADLVLSIERNVQGFVESTLKKALQTYEADSGTVVVMDTKTGGILAMASAPDFNPNDYRTMSQDDQWKFINPAVGSIWEPGSIFKTIVMASGLDHGVVEPDTEGVFAASVRVANYDIHTAENKAFGRETMTQVLENSDNVAMVWLADQLGNERMGETLQKLRFGQRLGIDVPGEETGILSDPSNWKDINRATISFGQGVSTTPLQIAAAMAALANGGSLLQPHLVEHIIQPDGTVEDIQPKVIQEGIISAETSAKIAAMMVSVVENGHGKRAKVPGYKIAGKTGTAQIPDPENGGYIEGAHVGGFAGFFPADNPRFAMVVKLDRPRTVQFAESSAAPTFGEIAAFMLSYYRIPPTEPVQ